MVSPFYTEVQQLVCLSSRDFKRAGNAVYLAGGLELVCFHSVTAAGRRNQKESFMPTCRVRAFVVLSFVAFFTGVCVMADESKEVQFPQLPTGAGKIDGDAPKTFSTTGSGLQYRILRKGTGNKPKATDEVRVNYHGWLDTGKVFDSSYQRGEAISFPLNRVIKGWTEGMQLVGEGGMIELTIPPDLAYGSRGAGRDVPPNATLHFLVELLKVE
jgi:FKBP-type peptidyl-prolyl cis-trans isomerase FkpA